MAKHGVVQAAQWLRDATAVLDPGPPVETVYRPLEYAWDVHHAYLERYGAGTKRALLVGMNPGPWGMGQTGVPFGDPQIVAAWLRLGDRAVEVPEEEFPERPVEGFASSHKEVSGQRLWGLLKELYGTAEAAHEHLLVANHCPLLMFDIQHRNVTPDKLRVGFRENLLEVCDEGLRRLAKATGAAVLIGVGSYAAQRCQAVATDLDVEAAVIPHPSPASPLANKAGGKPWRKEVERVFRRAGLVE